MTIVLLSAVDSIAVLPLWASTMRFVRANPSPFTTDMASSLLI
ncbi:MAG: hypothetical protein WA949_20340 [Phormidesmis sp.]